jgi:hypothetical protein
MQDGNSEDKLKNDVVAAPSGLNSWPPKIEDEAKPEVPMLPPPWTKTLTGQRWLDVAAGFLLPIVVAAMAYAWFTRLNTLPLTSGPLCSTYGEALLKVLPMPTTTFGLLPWPFLAVWQWRKRRALAIGVLAGLVLMSLFFVMNVFSYYHDPNSSLMLVPQNVIH